MWEREKIVRTLGIVLLVGVIFGAGFISGWSGISYHDRMFGSGTGKAEMLADSDFESFWKVWYLLNEKYVASDTITKQEKIWGAIKGLADSFKDPYTVFLPPEENKMFDEIVSGNFVGVGMEIGMQEEGITVIAPLKGTPADRGGVHTGDRILSIDHMSTADLSVDEAVQKIRGEEGTEVVLTLYRKETNTQFDVTLTRESIIVPTLDTELRSNSIFIIHLYSFSVLAPLEFRQALREFATSGATKLILDLRGNPGGFLDGAVDIASFFLPPQEVIVREGFARDSEEKVYRSRGYNVFPKGFPMAILVDEGSASASEIVAGALQEHAVAKLIGTKTFGKGSVQELVAITDDTSLKVTVARWFTPNNVSISDNGLEPDIRVEQNTDDLAKGIDTQMNKAIQYLSTL